MAATVKAEARLLLQQLTQFERASEALTRLFERFSAQDDRRCAVLLQLLYWQSTPASSALAGVLGDLEASGDGQTVVRKDMELTVLGKPALLFATSIYDEELASLIWSGFLQLHARYPAFDLARQVLDNSADSLGYSALHYAVEAQMGDFVHAVCKGLTQEETARIAARVVTQDVTLPVNTAQDMGKNIAITGEAPLSTADAAELRSKREKMARERYLAHLKPHESMLEPSVFPGIWTLEETTLVRSEVNRLADEQGWCKERHASYQTTDMPCHQVARVNSWVRATLADRLFPRIAKRYQLPKTQRLLFRDLFFVKYEAREGERSELALHRDGSVLSFNVLLNSADDFTGGGTYFDATKQTVHITQGDAAVHSGKVLHAGAPVQTGIRQILVGFVDVADCAY
jgi:hypothetical protein